MILDKLSNSEIMKLIDAYTTSEKLRTQLCDRLIDGKTYAEMGLAGDSLNARRQEKEYVTFRKKYDSFFLFVEKTINLRRANQ